MGACCSSRGDNDIILYYEKVHVKIALS